MPLPAPTLDTRTWAEMTAETRSMLPRLAPEWTDYNLHDPGITLLELLAWLTELQLFRVDRVTPALRRAYLKLVGVTPRPAGVAGTAVAVKAMGAGAATVALPAGTQVVDATGRTVFETISQLTVTPAWLDLGDRAPGSGLIVSEAAGHRVDLTASNGGDRAFEPLGQAPQPGDALLLGSDGPPVPAAGELSLFIWTESWRSDRETAQRLEDEARAVEEQCRKPHPGPWQSPEECEGRRLVASEPESERAPWLDHYSARTIWEVWDGGRWTPVTTVLDETRALTLSGSVRLAGAPTHARGPGDSRYWLRCRLAQGGYDCPPRLRAIAMNAVPVQHRATVRATQELGKSRGGPSELYSLEASPIVPGSTEIRVIKGNNAPDGLWHVVADWDETGPDNRHYCLDPSAGTIEFGDGRVGRVPFRGSSVRAVRCEIGGGEAGNVRRRSLVRTVTPTAAAVEIVQPFAAIGGRERESLDRAHGRVLERLASATRAVTTDDLEQLACETPGTPVGRAIALPGRHPAFPCLAAPGVVTVVVLPRCGDRPMPSGAMLLEVGRYLERRRPITTELHVVGPDYVGVEISATLHVPYSAGDVRADAQTALDRFFHPLRGGQDEKGWPLGRDVLESEVLAVLADVPGVAFADGLMIRVWTGALDGHGQTSRGCRCGSSTSTSETGRDAICGNLALCGIQVVDSRTHQLKVVKE